MKSSPGGAEAVVGVDIGGTKTHLRLEGPEGGRDVVLPSQSWRQRNWDGDAASLVRLVLDLAGHQRIDAMAVGAHGCDDGEECAAFQAAFADISPFPVEVVNDAELMPAALGLENQIGLVAGTGSIAVHRDRMGRMHVAGGWGWIIGDEGSAASLVREAARAVAYHLDWGGTVDDPLVRHLFETLAIPTAARIGSRLGQIGSAADIGAHAHLVFEAADEGSPIAQKVIEEGGRALASLVARLDARCADVDTVVAGGSVIAGQPSLWDAFSRSLREICDARITARLFSGAPVEGACNLARRLNRPASAVSSFPSSSVDIAAKAN